MIDWLIDFVNKWLKRSSERGEGVAVRRGEGDGLALPPHSRSCMLLSDQPGFEGIGLIIREKKMHV
jgi:hypothetical protein